MKQSTTAAIFVFLLFFCSNSVIGQITRPKLEKFENSLNQEGVTEESSPLGFYSFNKSLNRPNLYSKSTLNIFFTRQIASYLSSSQDLSLNSGFAFLDNKDNRLSIGRQWSNVGNNSTQLLSTVYSLGIKSGIKDGFSTFFKENDLQKDIGIEAKITFVFKGKIFYTPNTNECQLIINRKLLAKKIQNEINAELDILDTLRSDSKKINESCVSSEVEDHRNELYDRMGKKYKLKFAKEEAQAIIENNWYDWAWTHWLSLQAYVPVTESAYNISDNISTALFQPRIYNPINAGITYTNLFVNGRPWLGRVFISTTLSAFQNNSVDAEDISKFSYETYRNQNPTNINTLTLARLSEEEVYVGEFERFWTTRFEGTLVWMPFEWIGLRASFEQNFGDYDALDWRLGIPLSFQDKEGKRTINFELQWREINKTHSVGISIGLPFGQPLYE